MCVSVNLFLLTLAPSPFHGISALRNIVNSARAFPSQRPLHSLHPGADWPVGLLGWGPKGPPQQRSPWAPSVVEEKYFKWLILDELSDSDKSTSFNQRKIG